MQAVQSVYIPMSALGFRGARFMVDFVWCWWRMQSAEDLKLRDCQAGYLPVGLATASQDNETDWLHQKNKSRHDNDPCLPGSGHE